MSLMKWEPKKCYDPYKDFFDTNDDFFGLSLLPLSRRNLLPFQGGWPAIDVDEDDKQITVKADLPGLKKEDIDVSLSGHVLTIRGERQSETEDKKKSYHRVERSYGVFERNLDLGTNVDGSKIDAKYDSGVLTVVIPKNKQSHQNKIEIK